MKNAIIRNDEIWKPITELQVPNIKPVYMISNYGRIYSNLSNKIMNHSHINTGLEYPFKHLMDHLIN